MRRLKVVEPRINTAVITVITDISGEVSRCEICNAELLRHNVLGVCAECKHILRDRRRRFTAEEVSNLDEARAAFMSVFGGHYRQQSTDVIYSDTCRCGRFRARWDTDLCEWCSGPRRIPKKQRRQ